MRILSKKNNINTCLTKWLNQKSFILLYIPQDNHFFYGLPMSSFLESRELRKKYREVRTYVKIGPIFLTRYEKARIVGARALQISFGAPILVVKPKNLVDPIKIALIELKSQILPLTIRRELPSGEFQDIPISKLILKKD